MANHLKILSSEEWICFKIINLVNLIVNIINNIINISNILNFKNTGKFKIDWICVLNTTFLEFGRLKMIKWLKVIKYISYNYYKEEFEFILGMG